MTETKSTEYICSECGKTSETRERHCGELMEKKTVIVLEKSTRRCPQCNNTYQVGSIHNCPNN